MRVTGFLSFAFAVGMFCLAVTVFAAADAEGPMVAIDFGTSSTPDLTTIDSVYSGHDRNIYAFLVVDDMPGGYVTAYQIRFRLDCADSSIINRGFTSLGRWVSLDPAGGIPSDRLRLPGALTPTVIGFWRLELVDGTASSGTVLLASEPGGSNSRSLIYDREGQPVTPGLTVSGMINPGEPVPDDSLMASVDFTPRDSNGVPVLEDRTAKYVPGTIVARFLPGTVDIPEGRRSGTIDDIKAERLLQMLGELGLVAVKRLYSNATREGSEVVSRTGEVVRVYDIWDVYLLEFAHSADVWAVVDSLRSIPECLYVHPNYVSEACVAPNDSLYYGTIFNPQWNLGRIGMETAWHGQTGSTSVRIGILDTGIDYMHPDLGQGFGPGYKVAGGKDYACGCVYPMDYATGTYDSHGTSVAGIAGALTNNFLGIAGIAGGWEPVNLGCLLYALRVADEDAHFQNSDIYPAIRDAWPDYGIAVLNASFSRGGGPDTEMRSAILDAHKQGVVFVASKGNDGTSDHRYPADYEEDWVISVGSSGSVWPPYGVEERIDTLSGYGYSSNYGNGMDVLAPGVYAYTTRRTVHSEPYWEFGGTSAAAPHVTGLAALILSEPGSDTLSVEDIQGLICASCTDIRSDVRAPGQDLEGYDGWSGYGRINADSFSVFLSGCYRIDHFATTGGYSVSHTDWEGLTLLGSGELAAGPYFARRYDVRCDVTYPQTYGNFPRAWGRGYGASTGWSACHPNFRVGYCRVVQGTGTQTGCQLQSFVYEIRNVNGTPLGWHPCRPSQVVFAYTVLGGIPPAGVTSPEALHRDLVVYGPSQNPFVARTTISFQLGHPQEVEVAVFNIEGRRVCELLSERKQDGLHTVTWDGRDRSGRRLGAGVYFFHVKTMTSTCATKVVLVR